MQHDLAHINTWGEGDFRIVSSRYKDEFFDFDSFMRSFKDEVDKRLGRKVADKL